MVVNDVVSNILEMADADFAFEWDNSGLQVGDMSWEVSGVLICVDINMDVIMEAIQHGANLIISHHPFLFSPIKKVTEDNVKGQCIIKCIKEQIALFSAHTNMDVSPNGLNTYLASQFGLANIESLDDGHSQLMEFWGAFPTSATAVEAGAKLENLAFGVQSFGVSGSSSFLAGKLLKGKRKATERILASLATDYSIKLIEATKLGYGLGVVGDLDAAMGFEELASAAKGVFGCGRLRVSSGIGGKKLKRIAIVSGSGCDYIGAAASKGADCLITSDCKHKDFLQAADMGIALVCPSHFDSEKCFLPIVRQHLENSFQDNMIFESKAKDVEIVI
ncbi:MAG: Nif3-like dinuclear metal center hexameric protein [Eubacteriaceae bacterium]|nr:Nif3-like dinuclear metal center hexameric protein [Eubacteriaceae bacterium]